MMTLVGWTIACSGTPDQATIRVGSKDFTEQLILGEMYAQVLEQSGLKVERKLNLGGTPVVQASLLNGEIDLYPEYTGTGLLTVLKLPAQPDPKTVYQTVAAAYQKQFNLIWLQPAPMNNTQALVTTPAIAQQYGLKTIADFVAKADQLILVGPPEFAVREDGLPGIRRVYGDFKLKNFISTDAGLRYPALQSGQANVAVGFSTDGEIAADRLVILEDNKGLFPPYQVAPVVRQATLNAHPQIQTQLNAIAPHLTNATMQKLNDAVSGQKREPADVAREFLSSINLVKP